MELEFTKYAKYIEELPSLFTKDDLLVQTFLLYKENGIEIYYAPFDHVNENAKIVLIGITPGWAQMEIAYRCAKKGLQQGMSHIEVCAYAKREASFAGSMRNNLIKMLDGLGLPKFLGITSSALLFTDRWDLLHPTSAIRYPVFVNGQNYTGYNPYLLKLPVFIKYIERYLAKELECIGDALIIPLGKPVSDALRMLIDKKLIDSRRCLLGFPHPSGANGHREKQYRDRQSYFKKIIKDWFEERGIS